MMSGVRRGVAGMGVWAALVTGCTGPPAVGPPPQDNPLPLNFVWIVSDTPSGGVELLEEAGVRFTNATLADHPATGATRSALLTGVDPTVLGFDAGRLASIPPVGVRMLPELLRRAGYYTSRAGPALHGLTAKLHGDPANEPYLSAAETDQPGILGAWDAAGREVDWRGRDHDWEWPCTVNFGCGSSTAEIRPFFALFNVEALGRSPTATVSEIVERLDSDGLAPNTVVFYIGVGSPELELAVRWPNNVPAGTHRDDLVTVVDLAPTVLALAGVEAPPHMQGRVFLGPRTESPSTHDRRAALSNSEERAIRWTAAEPPVAAAPEGYPTGGLFHVAPRVELSCATEGSTIIYTTERAAPFYWRLYRDPFRMRFWTLRARCGRLGYRDSDIVTYDFDIE